MEALMATFPAAGVVAVVAVAAAVVLVAITIVWMDSKKRPNAPPKVPGLPLIGNLLQLKGKMAHKTFAKWSEIYGPIYTTKFGATLAVVLNSSEVVTEAMVDKYSSISTRKLSKAFSVLSHDKTMVSMSDYGDFHKMTKRFVMASLLGPSAQKQFQETRKHMMDNMVNIFRTSMIDAPHATQNFRKVYRAEIFRVNMIQVSVQIPRFSVLIRYCHDFVNLNRRGMSMLHF
jgi:ent-kaurene oxidase